MDLKSEIQRLWAAINDLRDKVAVDSGEAEDGVDETDIPEYVDPTSAHDAYYAGALGGTVTHNTCH